MRLEKFFQQKSSYLARKTRAIDVQFSSARIRRFRKAKEVNSVNFRGYYHDSIGYLDILSCFERSGIEQAEQGLNCVIDVIPHDLALDNHSIAYP